MAEAVLPSPFITALEALAEWLEAEQVPHATIGALRLKVATPEDLIIMKAIAHRPRDLADIESVMNANPTIDLERVRCRVSEFASVLEAPEILNDLEAILSRQYNR